MSIGRTSPERLWQTDKVTLLDSAALADATAKILKGGVLGTNEKKYDTHKVSSELIEMLFGELRDSSGVHVETALAALGAVAGFSCQMALRETIIKSGQLTEDKVFAAVKTKNGDTFYFGGSLNEILFANKPGALSIYEFVGGAAQKLGAKKLPNINEIVKYEAITLGGDDFGGLRLPNNHMPKSKPISLLDKFWNPFRNFLLINVPTPMHWPFVLGLSAQMIIIEAKEVIDPGLAAEIVMQSAIPMAKIDPSKIHLAYFQIK
ncbi:MAG: hypothetical protein JO216_16225 [Hyphomicrobiales bacterium]|nr:hypothetical protein [Hyphomicrobiales bacterium]